MTNEKAKDLVSVAFTWKVEYFSKLSNYKLYSDVFVIGDFKWRLLMYPRGNNVDNLSVYLEVEGSSKLPLRWSRYAQFSLTLVNQLQHSKSITKETEHEFNKKYSDWGFASLIPLSEFCDHSKGYLVNDICIIKAKVAVPKADVKILEDQNIGSSTAVEPSDQEHREQGPSKVDSLNVAATHKAPSSEVCSEPTDSHADPPIVKEHEDVFTPAVKLVDFRGLGKIEKAFVPLLDEVCACHPSLIECQQKRSHMFTEWAFTALGRLLHFLKTKKVKDMTDEVSEHLKLLWEELETFKFDLAWLEPHVQNVLEMKKFVERAGKLKRQREDVDALEIKTKRLRAELAVAEVHLEVAIRDLDKFEEGFEEIDMDSDLGYRGR